MVRSKLKPATDSETNSVRPCLAARCETCARISTDTEFKRNGVTHTTKGQFTCASANLVYLIRCEKGCGQGWYVGETRQTLRGRMTGHRGDIREDRRTTVADHFNLGGHSVADMRISVLQGRLRNTRERKMAEQKLADFLDTFEPNGLNRDHEFMSHYI